MLPMRDSLQGKRHTQTESKGMEKDISCKWKQKESRSSNTCIRQNDFKRKAITKDKEGHYIIKVINTRRGYYTH